MQVLIYEPMLMDRVTTVSLQYGTIVGGEGNTLVIKRADGTLYYACIDAVIRVTRFDQTYVVERRRNVNILHPYETSWAQKEFLYYMQNRTHHGHTTDQSWKRAGRDKGDGSPRL